MENKMNELAVKYAAERNEEQVVEMYELFTKIFQKKFSDWAKYDVKNNDVAEIQGQCEDVFLKSLDTYETTKCVPFIPYLRGNIKRRLIDMSKAESTRQSNHLAPISITSADNTDNNDVDPLDLVFDSTNNVEEIVIDKLSRKTDEEKKELVNFFFDNVEDSTTIDIMRMLTDHSDSKITENGIAKKLGLFNVQVNRKLTKLAKVYDSSRFGNPDEYLAG